MLAKSVSRLVLLSELRRGAAVVLTLAALGTGVGALALGPPQRDEARAPGEVPDGGRAAEARGPIDQRKLVEGMDWFVAAVDPERRTVSFDDLVGRRGGEGITIVGFRGGQAPSGLTIRGLRVAEEARITVDGRAAGLERLRAGMRITVELAPDRFAAAGIRAESPIPPASLYLLEEVDPVGRTLSVFVGGGRPVIEKIRVAEGVSVRLMDVPLDGALRLGNLSLADLRPGMPVALTMEMGEDGRLFVRSIMCARSPSGEERSR
jgi:hypothetical protein